MRLTLTTASRTVPEWRTADTPEGYIGFLRDIRTAVPRIGLNDASDFSVGKELELADDEYQRVAPILHRYKLMFTASDKGVVGSIMAEEARKTATRVPPARALAAIIAPRLPPALNRPPTFGAMPPALPLAGLRVPTSPPAPAPKAPKLAPLDWLGQVGGEIRVTKTKAGGMFYVKIKKGPGKVFTGPLRSHPLDAVVAAQVVHHG